MFKVLYNYLILKYLNQAEQSNSNNKKSDDTNNDNRSSGKKRWNLNFSKSESFFQNYSSIIKAHYEEDYYDIQYVLLIH